MKLFLRIIQTCLLVELCTAYFGNDKIAVTDDFFPEDLVVYEGKHDIVKLYVPLKYDQKEENNEVEEANSLTVFFVEADVGKSGNVKDQGLYVLKHGKATKLLNNGRDITSSNDYSKQVYFGATDGLYKYNEFENKAEKIGQINDNIIGLAREYHGDAIYILGEDHYVYRITDEGNTKAKVNIIGKADQIVLDFSNNLYFFGKNKQPFVYDGKRIKEIEGVPKNLQYANLIRPSFAIEDGVPFIANNKTFILYANGSSENIDLELEVFPSAYAMEATLIQYYAYNKKIYEYNILNVYLSNIVSEFTSSVEDREFMLSFMKKVAKSFPSHSRNY